jgi:hypothetical protein
MLLNSEILLIVIQSLWKKYKHMITSNQHIGYFHSSKAITLNTFASYFPPYGIFISFDISGSANYQYWFPDFCIYDLHYSSLFFVNPWISENILFYSQVWEIITNNSLGLYKFKWTTVYICLFLYVYLLR